MPGSFKCQCDASKGWAPGPTSQSDSQSVSQPNSQSEAFFQMSFGFDGQHSCQDLVASYSFFFKFQNFNQLEDLDECVEGVHTCDSHSMCINNRGSYFCRCLPGYEGLYSIYRFINFTKT